MSNEKKEFKPFVSADTTMRELSPFSIIVGILLAILFGAANAYLGLKIGMTISASIPAAVISMGLIRVILHRDSILENNMVQTIGSAGESVA
ncbi:MAG: OPT/YSL family transporter, partial [Lachnospiraceae bacterium]|nr:OPT/YSL family transporter [Lachnospiraceae bacterium]